MIAAPVLSHLSGFAAANRSALTLLQARGGGFVVYTTAVPEGEFVTSFEGTDTDHDDRPVFVEVTVGSTPDLFWVTVQDVDQEEPPYGKGEMSEDDMDARFDVEEQL
jgi:hypothetical protein